MIAKKASKGKLAKQKRKPSKLETQADKVAPHRWQASNTKLAS
jgi:hypothetical protein